MTDSIICREIRQWLDTHQCSMQALDTRVGLGSGYTCKALRWEGRVGPRALAKYAQLIDFSPEAVEEAQENYRNERQSKRNGAPIETGQKPWPVTVAELKSAKPIYARAW